MYTYRLYVGILCEVAGYALFSGKHTGQVERLGVRAWRLQGAGHLHIYHEGHDEGPRA